MSAKQNQRPRTELERMIERQIDQRTWGRIHRLRVESSEGRIVVYGHTASYHLKQLAGLAALEVLLSTDPTEIDLQIQVSASAAGRTHRRHGDWVSESA